MKNFVIGFDPASKSNNPCVVTIHKGDASTPEGTLIAEYHHRPSGKKAFERDVRQAAKYFGAALKSIPKNWFK